MESNSYETNKTESSECQSKHTEVKANVSEFLENLTSLSSSIYDYEKSMTSIPSKITGPIPSVFNKMTDKQRTEKLDQICKQLDSSEKYS